MKSVSHAGISVKAVLLLFLLHLQSNAWTQPTSIFTAIRNNDATTLQDLLNRGVNVNLADTDGDYPLMLASVYGSADIMELLLSKGVNVNARNRDGETALMWASHDLDKTRLLLQHGADINAKAHSGNTVLLMACVGSGQFETVKFLIDKGADPLIKNERKETSLTRAALFGDTSTLSLLVRKGVRVNDMDSSGVTPLLNAALNVNREATLWLLENGADPDLVASFGFTALTAVVIFNDNVSVQAVLNKTKNINHTDAGGYSPLMMAAYNEHDNIQVIQALLDKGADVNNRAKDGTTALSWALKKGNTKTVSLLRKAGAH